MDEIEAQGGSTILTPLTPQLSIATPTTPAQPLPQTPKKRSHSPPARQERRKSPPSVAVLSVRSTEGSDARPFIVPAGGVQSAVPQQLQRLLADWQQQQQVPNRNCMSPFC